MAEERQTVSGAYAKIEGHEELCSERYANIHGRIDLIFKVLGVGGLILISVAGWSLNRLADKQDTQTQMLEQALRDRGR